MKALQTRTITHNFSINLTAIESKLLMAYGWDRVCFDAQKEMNTAVTGINMAFGMPKPSGRFHAIFSVTVLNNWYFNFDTKINQQEILTRLLLELKRIIIKLKIKSNENNL